jgi:alkylation response protein AidB-like acyl-CoA dehydrogenase
MLYKLAEEELLIQKTAREFAEKELSGLASKIDKEGALPKEILKKMADLGFMGMLVPVEYGGSGLDNFSLTLVAIEVNRICASTGITMSVHNSLATSPIINFGSPEQKEKYLPRLAKGEWIGAYSLTEPEAGSDAGSIRTSATLRGDFYILNGTKNFVTNGGVADLFIVFARTHPDRSLRAKGISAFIVEKSFKGLTIGKEEGKLGIRGSSTVSLSFEDCKIPKENLLGKENGGFGIAMQTLDGGRIGVAAQAIGIAQASLEISVKYAIQRRQFGRFLREFQAIQWKLSDIATRLEAAKLLVYHAAKLRDMGLPHTKEAAMAKLFASELANYAAKEAIQIHGGAGYTKDFPAERLFRDAKITEIYEGTSEIQRIVIARELFK